MASAKLTVEKHVLKFFEQKQSAFGCTNVLSPHLPSASRVVDLVRNNMTIDWAISVAYDQPYYANLLLSFSGSHDCSQGDTGVRSRQPIADPLSDRDRSVYQQHLQRLRQLDYAGLAELLQHSTTSAIDSVHLFCPKQCNMICDGCYASAIPVAKKPYLANDIDSYFEGAKKLIEQAKALGATTIQTSGDGEVTIFPKFFDLLEFVTSKNMQWLIFTAGLIFSSEKAAAQYWETSANNMSTPVRSRIEFNIEKFSREGATKPTVRAFLSEIYRHRENLHLYHSIWSTRSERNSEWRRPQFGDYEYAGCRVGDWQLELPSSLIDLMEIFSGDLRARLGVEFPVSRASVEDVPGLAAFVAKKELRSYFEPVIRTGRARGGRIGGQTESRCSAAENDWSEIAPLLVRKECSFRFIHQPIVKFKSSAATAGFFASPGTGVDLDDLSQMGVLESTGTDDGLFSAIHSSLIAHANYRYTTGCKCNDFSHQMKSDYGSIAAEWRKIAEFTIPSVTAGGLLNRIAVMASSSRVAASVQ